VILWLGIYSISTFRGMIGAINAISIRIYAYSAAVIPTPACAALLRGHAAPLRLNDH
jgi:hypothetical protein